MGFIRRYAGFLVACPYVMIIMIIILVIGVSVPSLVPAAGAPEHPDFSQPTKGFEPRGTTISRRTKVFRNFETAIAFGWDKYTFYPENMVITHNSLEQSHRRITRDTTRNMTLLLELISCKNSYEKFVSNPDTVVIYGGNDLLNAASLKAICRMDNDYVRSAKGFSYGCMRNAYGCCPSLSLGNFIAVIHNKESCQDITDLDVMSGLNKLKDCAEFYFNGDLVKCLHTPTKCNVPLQCSAFGSVFSIFYYLTDKNFLNPNEELKYTSVLSPIPWWSNNLYENIYHSHFKDLKSLSQDGVAVEGFHFADFKYEHFSQQLLNDTVYIALALVCILVLVCFYTCSVFLAFITILNILFASLLGYFLYHVAFGLKFFPFLNMTAIIFLVGISADDVFVYHDIWCEAKKIYPHGSLTDWTEYTMHFAAKSMFVTSFTTSSAFYAIVTSHITSLKCFGIFTGTTILCLYFLMVTWFPSVLIIYEKCCKCCHQTSSETHVSRDQNASRFQQHDLVTSWQQTQHQTTTSLTQTSSPTSAATCCCSNPLRKLKVKMFSQWLPMVVNKLKYFLLFGMLGVVGYFLYVVFYQPGLSIPTTDGLQLFHSSHPLEQYGLRLKSKFRFASPQEYTDSIGREGYLIWGVRDIDNGNFLDPDDEGNLEWDTPPDISSPESQKWLLKLCKDMRKQPFYGKDSTTTCFMEDFVDMMSQHCTKDVFPCCKDSQFPYERKVFNLCLRVDSIYSGGIREKNGPVFDVKTGQIVALVIPLPTNSIFSQEYKVNDKFWKETNSWFDDIISSAPQGLSHGWLAVTWLGFYDLQESLSSGTLSSVGLSIALAFAVMFLTTLNILITVYSILTIISIIAVTVGSLVLMGWQLNILESMTVSIAVGLAVDFTVHYGVAYCLAVDKDHREGRVHYALEHIGSAVAMAALTTLCTGALMMPSEVLAYHQMGLFLALVMFISWSFATFLFLPICAIIGPTQYFGQLSFSKICKPNSRHSVYFSIDETGCQEQYVTCFDVMPNEDVKNGGKKVRHSVNAAKIETEV